MVTLSPLLMAMRSARNLVITIFQRWTHIAVFLTTATSMSRSCAAVIQVDDPESVTLIYQYQNQPLADAMKTMHMHYGTAMLRESLTAAA
jgi:hypothetical protein